MAARKLKLFMTTDTVGGVWNYSLDLCRALYTYNLEIHLLGLGGIPDENQQKEVKLLPNVHFYATNLKLEWMDNPWKDVAKTEQKIEALCAIIKPDLLHFNNFIGTKVFAHVPRLTVFHSCVKTWWHSVKNSELPSHWDTYSEVLRSACNTSDVVIFPTEAIRETAEVLHEISTPQNVIYNARHLEINGKVEKENIILCTGRIWDEAKNLMVLCELAKSIPWPIYVAGENSNPNTGEKISLPNVRFLGKLNSEELRYWLERTAIYINPALYEPFGLAVLEAAMANCALAISDLSTLKEIWKDSALYFDPNDKEDMLNTILKLVEDEDFRKEHQYKARVRSKRFSIEAMGAAYFQQYLRLLKSEREVQRQSIKSVSKLMSRPNNKQSFIF